MKSHLAYDVRVVIAGIEGVVDVAERDRWAERIRGAVAAVLPPEASVVVKRASLDLELAREGLTSRRPTRGGDGGSGGA